MRHPSGNLLVRKLIFTFGRSAFVLLVFLGIAFYLISVSAKYTLIDHEFYQGLADRQQIRTESSFVNRGTIYAKGGAEKDEAVILSASAVLKDLKIDPSQEGDHERLLDFLLEVVYRHLCDDKALLICYDNVRHYTKNYDLSGDFRFEKTYIFDALRPTIYEQIHRKYKTRILVATDVNQDTLANLRSLENDGIIIEGEMVYIDPTRYGRSSNDSTTLAAILEVSVSQIQEAMKLRINRNVNIVDKLDLELSEFVVETIRQDRENVRNKTLPLSDALYSFLKLEDRPMRLYPEGEITSHITGFVDAQNKGQYGIEGFFENQLAGEGSDIRRHKDALGRPVESLGEERAKEIRGLDIYLTIDRNIQKELMSIMQQAVLNTGSNSGSALVMDPKTGAIRAMVNYPTYDPDRPGNVYNIQRFKPGEYGDPVNFSLGKPMFIQDPVGELKKTYEGEVYRFYEIQYEDELREHILDPTKSKYIYENGIGLGAYLNQTISSLYEPGSVFKGITVAIGLDSGEIKPDTMYEDVGTVIIDNFEINNLIQERCMGWHSFRNALNFSCNVGMVRIVQRIGTPLFHQYLKEFGFGERTGISLDGEVTGILQPYEKWSRAQLFTTSFGQGIQVTLLQMAAAYSVLANGGVYMQPYIVESRVYPSGEQIQTVPKTLRRVISPDTSKKITAMLTEGVQIGFASAGSVDGYDIAGKTGTSQIATRGVYERGGSGHTITSFGGYGPSSDPKFVIVVKFDRPRSTQYAASSSAYAFQEIAQYLLHYYNIPKDS